MAKKEVAVVVRIKTMLIETKEEKTTKLLFSKVKR